MACGAFFAALMPPKSSETAAETAARPPCPHLKPPQVAGRRTRRPRRGRGAACSVAPDGAGAWLGMLAALRADASYSKDCLLRTRPECSRLDVLSWRSTNVQG